MTATEKTNPTLSRCLIALFFLAMVMGTGPGTLLVNRAVTIEGIPLLYLWGILWYVVLVVIALVAYFRIWNDETDQHKSGDSE